MQHDFILPFLRASLTEDQLCRVEASTQPQNVRSGIQRKGFFFAHFCSPSQRSPPAAPAASLLILCIRENVGMKFPEFHYHSRHIIPDACTTPSLPLDFGEFFGVPKVLAPKKKNGDQFLLQKNRLHLSESTSNQPWEKQCPMPTVL